MKIVQNILTSATILGIDYIYLSLIAPFFGDMIRSIQGNGMKVKLHGALLCYLLLKFGLEYFILNNPKKKIKESVKDAFILGIVIYGVFETTSYTIIDKWNINAVFIDTLWGGILFGLSTYIILKYIKPISF